MLIKNIDENWRDAPMKTLDVMKEAGSVRAIQEFPRRDSKPKKRLPNKQGDTMCIIVFDVHHRPVFSEYLLRFGVSSGKFGDAVIVCDSVLLS